MENLSPTYLVLVRVISPVALAVLVFLAYRRLRLPSLLWLFAAVVWEMIHGDLSWWAFGQWAGTTVTAQGAHLYGLIAANYGSLLIWYALALVFLTGLIREVRDLQAAAEPGGESLGAV